MYCVAALLWPLHLEFIYGRKVDAAPVSDTDRSLGSSQEAAKPSCSRHVLSRLAAYWIQSWSTLFAALLNIILKCTTGRPSDAWWWWVGLDRRSTRR